jgi:hypothetical protein
LDFVLFFKLVKLANKVLKSTTCKAHYSVFYRYNLVCFLRTSHASVALFLFNFKYESVHVRVDKINRFVCSKVILDGLSHCIHLTFYGVHLLINLFKLRAKIWVNDVVVLLSFTDVDAFLKHSFELSKLLECSVQGLYNLGPQRMILLRYVLI